MTPFGNSHHLDHSSHPPLRYLNDVVLLCSLVPSLPISATARPCSLTVLWPRHPSLGDIHGLLLERLHSPDCITFTLDIVGLVLSRISVLQAKDEAPFGTLYFQWTATPVVILLGKRSANRVRYICQYPGDLVLRLRHYPSFSALYEILNKRSLVFDARRNG